MAIVQYWIGTHGPFEYEDTDAEHDYPEQMARKQDVADGMTVMADSVEEEILYGLSANAGTSDDASRSDHTHGSPEYPSRFPLEGSDYSEFEASGTLKFNGAATTWDDINESLQSLRSVGVTVLDDIVVDSNTFRAFTGTGVQAQFAEGSTEILHPYKEGSSIEPHVHWMPEDANTGDVKFTLGYRWWNKNGVMPAETLISVVQAAPGVAFQSLKASFPIIDGTGKEHGSRFVYRVIRDPADAADTYEHHAVGLDFGIHYEKDTTGSRTVSTK